MQTDRDALRPCARGWRNSGGRKAAIFASILAGPHAVEADLAFGSAPALPYSVTAPAMRFAGELLGILAQHLLDSFNPSRQTKALKRAVHILPSRLNWARAQTMRSW